MKMSHQPFLIILVIIVFRFVPGGRLISIGGIDIGTQQPVDGLTLSSPLDTYTETKMITPVTTLLETEEDEAEIKEALGIPEYLI